MSFFSKNPKKPQKTQFFGKITANFTKILTFSHFCKNSLVKLRLFLPKFLLFSSCIEVYLSVSLFFIFVFSLFIAFLYIFSISFSPLLFTFHSHNIFFILSCMSRRISTQEDISGSFRSGYFFRISDSS